MFYVNASTAGDHLSLECRDAVLTHSTRRLLDRRTADRVSRMMRTDEVYPRKDRRRRSDHTQGFSSAADPLEAILPASSFFGDKLGAEDGSGELPYEAIPPADDISEEIVDNQDNAVLPSPDVVSERRLTQMVPYADVVFPQQSTMLRMFHFY